MDIVLKVFILIFSVVIHEISHGFTALSFGDKTAQYEGRLTLNPIKHLDWFGSVVLPFLLYFLNIGFMIGWAKPVPYNPYNLKNRAVAEPLVALAGPVSNFFVAIVFGLAIRLLPYIAISPELVLKITSVFSLVVLVNVSLAVFNLLPFPPLDGSKILSAILPTSARYKFIAFSDRYGLMLIFVFIMFLPDLISPVIEKLFYLIVGLN